MYCQVIVISLDGVSIHLTCKQIVEGPDQNEETVGWSRPWKSAYANMGI